MDQPFAALHALTRERMNLELLRIWSERRKAVLFITPDTRQAVFLADRVMALSARPAAMVGSIDIRNAAAPNVEATDGSSVRCLLRRDLPPARHRGRGDVSRAFAPAKHQLSSW
jgi:ABC-type nitrate/sulfonate/bicarbonate transport system ATPase subunit